MRILEIIALGITYIITSGAWFTDWGKRHKSLVIAVGILAIAQTGYFFKERFSDWFGAENSCDGAATHWKSASAIGTIDALEDHLQKFPRCGFVALASARIEAIRRAPDNPLPAPPTKNLALKADAAAQTKMFWGTLPPNGDPAILYSITNLTAESMKDVSASAWIVEEGKAKKLDERHIGYIGPAEFRRVQVLMPSTPHGRGLLCISLVYGGDRVDILHFFQSAGEYAKYGPMKEMQRFRDPMVSNGRDALCQTVGAKAAALISQ
jgi:hypothetical protein